MDDTIYIRFVGGLWHNQFRYVRRDMPYLHVRLPRKLPLFSMNPVSVTDDVIKTMTYRLERVCCGTISFLEYHENIERDVDSGGDGRTDSWIVTGFDTKNSLNSNQPI